MVAHRSLADKQLGRYHLVVESLGDKLDDLVLAIGKTVRLRGFAARFCDIPIRVFGIRPALFPRFGAHQRIHPPDDLAAEYALARYDRANRRRDVRNFLLDQVSAGTHAQSLDDVLVVGERCEENDFRIGMAGKDPPRRRKPVRARHLNVHQQNIGSELGEQRRGLGPVGSGCAHLDIALS